MGQNDPIDWMMIGAMCAFVLYLAVQTIREMWNRRH